MSPVAATRPRKPESFHWGPAVGQSVLYLGAQTTGNLAMDNFMRYDLTHGHFVHKWFQSVRNYRWSVWNDNDPFLDDYIAHPIMGAALGFIQIQNDSGGRSLRLENSSRYWHSRLKATAWAALWGLEWKIGPLSEASIGDTGLGKYYSDSSRGLTNGTGMVDLVVTPMGGLVWMLGEDVIDKYIVQPLQQRFNYRAVRMATSVLNPSRSAANILRLRAPWHRDWRQPISVASSSSEGSHAR